ncbi:MAG TPA: VacB/RNase II family 3'-5' exoribonuclease [Terriglobia bacterium]|jgi:ribonuclease R|nr:VacB/RNase II family 3'-5' exoribonuclease [Terriglobia bacterium]
MRDFPTDGEILKVFERQPDKTFRLRELIVELELRSSDAPELKEALKALSKQRRILYLKKGHFTLDRHGRQSPATAAPLPDPKPRSRFARGGLISGRLIAHRDGYGFVVPDDPRIGADIFIPPSGMNSALHGDHVEVHVIEKRPPRAGQIRHGEGRRGPAGKRPGRERDGGLRLEGRIVNVTDRAQKTVVGEFRCGARGNVVAPYDRHIPFEIVIPRGEEWPEQDLSRDRQFGGESSGAARNPARGGAHRNARDLEGLVVDVEITSFPDPVRGIPPRGRVIEILGRREEFGVDVEIIIRKYHLPHRFAEEVLADAARAPQQVSPADIDGRRDFRALPIVTIDGETAKDFDDAVYVERRPGGHYALQVHIADVAHYVRPGSALDREARLRGTSVYFPDRAVPMLPLDLSNGICSLNPHLDRLTMSCMMEIDPRGRVVAYELAPGVIRSARRMTYTAVYAVLRGDAEALTEYSSLADQFHLMEELALILNQRRHSRGSIDFDLPAPEIEFDEQGRMTGVTRSERNIAHRLIEEFMLAANETVATHLERCGVPTLYRIHEQPDPKKVIEFEEIAAAFGQTLGVELPPARRTKVHARDDRDRYPRFEQQLEAGEFKITSRHYQRLAERIAGKPEERILSYLMLRSLKQARYSEENVGHFALASSTYTHFTSPIRRYPDLIVHRTLKALLGAQGGFGKVEGAANPAATQSNVRVETPAPGCEGGVRIENAELHALGLETSESERRAADAERELMDWKKVVFMTERLGDEFEALVISLTRHGFFVELTDLFVEGFVPLDSMEDDRYVFRENLRAIVGLTSGYAYHLGDRVQVRLDRIDRVDNRLEFSVVAEDAHAPALRPRRK